MLLGRRELARYYWDKKSNGGKKKNWDKPVWEIFAVGKIDWEFLIRKNGLQGPDILVIASVWVKTAFYIGYLFFTQKIYSGYQQSLLWVC